LTQNRTKKRTRSPRNLTLAKHVQHYSFINDSNFNFANDSNFNFTNPK
jgi:hypothetical protein